jgi:hypothetical protein
MAKDRKRTPEAEAFLALPVPDGYEQLKIRNARGPDIVAHGKLLHTYGEQHEGRKARYAVIELWRTPTGNHIAIDENRSDITGESDIIKAKAFGPLLLPADQIALMDFFAWSNDADKLRRAMGWIFTDIVL